jgi:uncharacterized membrane protein
VATALRLLPAGSLILMVFGLLPMALFLFASASPDAAVISAAFLFTAIAVRASFRGRWTYAEVAAGCFAGAVYCSLKPIYAPLLFIGLPAVLRRGAAAHVLAVQAFLLAFVLGFTALWLSFSAPDMALPPREGTNPSAQLAGMLAQPNVFASIVLTTLRLDIGLWALEMIGVLGWLTILLPTSMYAMPILAVIAAAMTEPKVEPRISLLELAWQLILLVTSALLVLVALYIYSTPVGLGIIIGVQGRYFLPLAGLSALTIYAVAPPSTVLSAALRTGALVLIAVEAFFTLVLVAVAYGVM